MQCFSAKAKNRLFVLAEFLFFWEVGERGIPTEPAGWVIFSRELADIYILTSSDRLKLLWVGSWQDGCDTFCLNCACTLDLKAVHPCHLSERRRQQWCAAVAFELIQLPPSHLTSTNGKLGRPHRVSAASRAAPSWSCPS